MLTKLKQLRHNWDAVGVLLFCSGFWAVAGLAAKALIH